MVLSSVVEFLAFAIGIGGWLVFGIVVLYIANWSG